MDTMKKMIFLLFVIVVLGIGIGAYFATTKDTTSPLPTSTPSTTQVKVYFENSNLDPEISCQKVFPVTRTIPYTTAVGTAAINELLKGVTNAEKTQGYSTALPTGVRLVKLIITDGVALAEFDEALEYQMGGSCRVGLVRRQITETLKQFSTVKSVVISIDGRTEDILQP